MIEQRYTVEWDGDLSAAAETDLAAVDVVHIISTGGGWGGMENQLPESRHHVALVLAASEQAAIERVRGALTDHGTCTGFVAHRSASGHV